ncbi:MAG: ATP-binding protein [Desulfonauticus sp.]|nr:ATP-binding protein [Desulfonauticus sp.]
MNSLKSQLIIIVFISFIVTIILPSLYLFNFLDHSLKKEIFYDLKKELDYTKLIISQKNFSSLSDLDKLLKVIAQKTGVYISCISETGTVLADSRIPREKLSSLGNQISYPEIMQAKSGEEGFSIRFNPNLQKKIIYLARKIVLPNLVSGYLRIGKAYPPILSLVAVLGREFLLIVLFSILIVSLLIFIILNKKFKQIYSSFIPAIQEIGKGNFEQKIYDVSIKEFEVLAEAINKMVEDIQEHLEHISNKKIEVESIFNGIDAGIAAINREGKVVQCNRAFELIFPQVQDYIGKTLLEITFNADLHKICLQALQENKSIKNFEITLDSSYYNVNIIRIKNNKDFGAIIILHDISYLKKVENMKKDFIANASHELRTPLTSIRGYTETLLNNHKIFKEKGREILQIILKHSEHMKNILEDILELSKIESGKKEFTFEEVNLEEIVDKCWSRVKHLVGKKNIRFINTFKDTAYTFVTDKEAISHVLQNLFQNSIKFVPEDKGVIKVLFKEKGDKLILGVEDNGPGIPKEEQHRVFERFYQVKKYVSQGIKGTGLGLSICKNLIHNLGGKIWIESPVTNSTQGCIVWFFLPRPKNKKHAE